MPKYHALGVFLSKQTLPELAMTFSEIERVVGAKLPRSAYEHRPWWSNNGSNSVMTKEWLSAGYHTAQVDMTGRKLVFKRVTQAADGMNDPASPFLHDTPDAVKTRSIVGALKGTFSLETDFDVTAPAMPEWADLIDEKYGPETTR